MNKKMPRTPFSTALSRSAREIELRLRNIMSGPKKRPPLPFLILMFSVCIFCGNIVSCQFREETPPDVSQPASSRQEDPDPDTRLNNMVLDFLQNEYACAAYLPEDIPEQPQPGDRCLDSAGMIADGLLDEILYSLYEIDTRVYIQNEGWQPSSPAYAVLTMAQGVDFTPVAVYNYSADADPSDIMCQAIWGLMNVEVCLFRDGFSTPIDLGNWVDPMFQEFEPEVVIHEGWEPTYQPGDYWDEWSVEGATALRYYNAEPGSYHLNNMKVTRSDMYTYRGIRVGSSREEVLAAYPEIHDEPYWGDIDADYLWYGDENEFGPTLLFNFVDDKVDSIVLSYVLD